MENEELPADGSAALPGGDFGTSRLRRHQTDYNNIELRIRGQSQPVSCTRDGIGDVSSIRLTAKMSRYPQG
jgi:hypothetical protein